MYVLWIMIFILALPGCGSKSQADRTSGEKPASAPQQMPGMAQPEQPTGNVVKGRVLERADASSYSYLRLATASGEMWAAVPQTDIAVGTEVTVLNASHMDGFESKTLNRKFDQIVFGTLGGQNKGSMQPMTAQGADQPASAHGGSMPPGHPAAGNPLSSEPIKVEKAPGAQGRTVSEIFAQKSKLKDQQVAVRGKVVKVNANIMGKTWIHLRDGSGSRDANTDDITVTTVDSAAVGDVVLVKGKIRTDKDFGSGYSFSVIIEDAKVTK